MKKIYTLIAAMITVASFAQTASTEPQVTGGVARPLVRPAAPMGERAGSDTTGIGANVIASSLFLPEFAPSGTVVTYYTGTSISSGGYVFGNNLYGMNTCAQGYQNVSGTSARVTGAILWMSKKRSSGASSPTSKIVVKAWAMAANKGYNDDGAGGSAFNSPGPSTAPAAPAASADLLFSAIDTAFLMDNYVAFATPPIFLGDFAIGIDCSTLTAGDTVGLFADDASAGDAGQLDYAFNYYSGKWWVSDHIWSASGSGDSDNDIAIFAVYSDVTGVNEYFNGMKLTTYPNPAVNNVTIEYTLEKSAPSVKLSVFDHAGRMIMDNNYSNQTAGTYKVNLDASTLAAGSYFYQLTVNGSHFTKQVVITK